MSKYAQRGLGSARVSRVGERVSRSRTFLPFGTISERLESKKSLFQRDAETNTRQACYPTSRELHLHDFRFLVLEMIVDRFNEAIG
jgi:hypothetical protein